MTATTVPTPLATKRPPLVLIVNLCFAVFLLAALPVIHHGQKGFLPYASMDKDYINAAISSGEAEFMHQALRTTEAGRALAHESHIETMTLMQLAVLALVVLFAFNCFFLYRQHRQELVRLPRGA
jgi:hypothetical protein